MTENDCLKQMNDRYALFQTLWNMYFVVSFGVLAFLVNAKFHNPVLFWSAKAVAVIAYGCFAYSNLGGLRRVRNEHDSFGTAFSKLTGNPGTDPAIVQLQKELARYIQLPKEKLLVRTYLVSCGLVVVLLLLIPLADTKS